MPCWTIASEALKYGLLANTNTCGLGLAGYHELQLASYPAMDEQPVAKVPVEKEGRLSLNKLENVLHPAADDKACQFHVGNRGYSR